MESGKRHRALLEQAEGTIRALRTELKDVLGTIPTVLRTFPSGHLLPAGNLLLDSSGSETFNQLLIEPTPSGQGSGRWLALEQELATLPSEPSHDDQLMESAFTRLQEEAQGADEHNLLDERDMHVFGHEPMKDTLDLVTCNLCQRTVLASQFMAHAQRCRLLNNGGAVLQGGGGQLQEPVGMGLPPVAPLKKGPRKRSQKPAGSSKDKAARLQKARFSNHELDDSAPLEGAKRLKLSDAHNDSHEGFLGGATPSRKDEWGPSPLACKIYCFRHRHRMRALLSTLLHEALAAQEKDPLGRSPQMWSPRGGSPVVPQGWSPQMGCPRGGPPAEAQGGQGEEQKAGRRQSTPKAPPVPPLQKVPPVPAQHPQSRGAEHLSKSGLGQGSRQQKQLKTLQEVQQLALKQQVHQVARYWPNQGQHQDLLSPRLSTQQAA